MRLSTVLGIKKTTTMTARFLTLGVIISGLLSLGFGVVTFYGLSTGSFVISMNEEAVAKGIQLSDHPLFPEESASSRLYVDPKEESDEATYSYLKIAEAQANDGLYDDDDADYLAYSFYVRNNGLEMINLTYEINIVEVSKNLDEYIRIMILVEQVGAEPFGYTQQMYMKPDETPKNYPIGMPEAKHFLSDQYSRDPIISETIEKLQTQKVLKFTVFMWIEGYDTEPNMERGSIRIDMKFSIRNAAA